ncbi:MAG: c-type cytochrome [Silvanigrellaceae bacterium]
MKLMFLVTSVLFAVVVGGCSAANKGDAVLPIPGMAKSAGGSGDAGAANPSASNSSPATTAGSSVVFNLAEAKPYCVGCHVAGASGAGVWAKADGTEADWKAFAATAKNSVQADRMPSGGMTADAKAKFIGYLDSLLGVAPGGAASTGGGSTTAAFTLAEAKLFCVGCHSSTASGTAAAAWNKADGTENDWKTYAATAKASVEAGRMPKGGMSDADKSKFIAYLDSLLGAAANGPYTFATAKGLCAGCHGATATGVAGLAWNKADGTENDWKLYASTARIVVRNNLMPKPVGSLSAENKTKLLSYLDTLAGTAPVFDFNAAKGLCVHCHYQGQGGRSPRLETVQDWSNNKSDIKSEVEKTSGGMPRGMTLTPDERQALLNYINSL